MLPIDLINEQYVNSTRPPNSANVSSTFMGMQGGGNLRRYPDRNGYVDNGAQNTTSAAAGAQAGSGDGGYGGGDGCYGGGDAGMGGGGDMGNHYLRAADNPLLIPHY